MLTFLFPDLKNNNQFECIMKQNVSLTACTNQTEISNVTTEYYKLYAKTKLDFSVSFIKYLPLTYR